MGFKFTRSQGCHGTGLGSVKSKEMNTSSFVMAYWNIDIIPTMFNNVIAFWIYSVSFAQWHLMNIS